MNKRKIKCLYLPCVLFVIAIILGIVVSYMLIVEIESVMTAQYPESYIPECDYTCVLKTFIVIGTILYLLFVYLYCDKVERECKGEKDGPD